MFKRCFVTLMIAAAFVAPNMVQAQPEMHRDPMALYREAGANEEQQKQISQLIKQFDNNARSKSEQAMSLLKKMQDYSLEPMPDEKQVLATQSEINALQAEMANARIQLTLQVRKILNPQQREHLVELLKKQHAAQSQR